MTRGKAGCYSGRILPSALQFNVPLIAHNYSATSGEAADFSSLAVGRNDITYQWQAYLYGGWQDIYGKTTASVTITPGDLYSPSDAYIPIRCVATSQTPTYQQLTSDVVRHAQFYQANYANGMYAYVFGSDGSFASTSYVTVAGESYLELQLGATEALKWSTGALSSGSGDYSWFAGDDFLFSIEESLDASTWSAVASAGYRQYPEWNGTLNYGGLTGQNRYYRLNVTRPWPLTAASNNSSNFANRLPLSGVLLRWLATWS